MNTIVKKLALVKNIELLPNKILVNGRNIQLDKNLAVIENENGNELLFSVIYDICGIITSQDRLIVFSTNNGTISEIGFYKEGVGYNTVIIGDFGFKTDYILTGVIDYNINGELIVCWTDRVNPIGLLNVDNLPFTLPDSKIASVVELNLCKLYPDCIVPDMKVIAVNAGGNIKSGVVQFAATYLLDNGDYVNWLNITNPTPIGMVDPVVPYKFKSGGGATITNVYLDGKTSVTPAIAIRNESHDAIQQLDVDYVSKCVSIEISNLDIRYKKIKVAAIHKHKLGVFVYEVGDYDISNKDKITVVYNGSNIGDLSIDEITTNNNAYTKCDSITAVANRLILGNVSVGSKIDFQPFANAIKVGYKLERLPFDRENGPLATDSMGWKSIYCHIDPVQASNNRSLMPDEVYALYVAPILLNGSEGQAFHIPGRAAEQMMLFTAKENDLLSNPAFNDIKKLIPSFNTLGSLSPNVRYFHGFDTSSKLEYNHDGYNKLSYWENDTETYPDDEAYIVKEVTELGNPFPVGDLRKAKVRHHKMPSMQSMYKDDEDINKAIYLEFSNINIPKDIHDKIQGLRFYYAERNSDNMTIIGEFPIVVDGFPNEYTVMKPDILMSKAEYEIQYIHNLRFNDYNLLVNKPSLNASYVKVQYKSNNDNYGMIGTRERKDSFIRKDYTAKQLENTWTYHYTRYLQFNDIIPIEAIAYQPHDNAATIPSNKGRESTVSIRVPKEFDMKMYDPNYYSQAFIGTLNKLIFDIYTTFTNQKLVTTNYILRLQPNVYRYNVPEVKGFDVFINSYRTMMYRGDRSIIDPVKFTFEQGINVPNNALINEFKFVSYSIINTPYRVNVDIGMLFSSNLTKGVTLIMNTKPIQTYTGDFYKQTNFNTDPSVEELPLYHNEFSAVNNLKSILKFNVIDNFVERLPNRITRSNVQGKESINIAWRLFSPLDYYDTIKDKGEIVAVHSISNGIMIQLKYGLLKAVIKDKLMTLGEDTYLGTGDMFDREPQELLPTDKGYIGCMSPLSIVMNELGYVVVDAMAKRVFIVNDNGVKELTSQLVKEEFDRLFQIQPLVVIPDSELIEEQFIGNESIGYSYTTIPGSSTGGTPVGQRVCTVFDPLNHKLIISNHLDVPFTMSYYDGGEELGFLSKHDYIPFLLASTRNNVYSVPVANKNQVYKHNADNKGTYYGVKYPSKVAVLFNLGQEFMLNNIAINSNVRKEYNRFMETISKLVIYNQFQCSGNIDIAVFNSIADYNKIRNIGNTWYYNYFRDLQANGDEQCIDIDGEVIETNINNNKEWFDQSPFISNLVVIQMEFDNNDDKEFTLNDVNVNANEFKR